MERKVFRGIGAVIASIASDRRFDIVARMKWSEPTSFDVSRRIPIDLDRCPSKAASWSEIEVDDRGVDAQGEPLGTAMHPAQLPGHQVTALGGYRGKDLPDDLARGPFVGGIYLEDAFFDRHRSKIDRPGDPWPTGGRTPCQLTTVAYSGHPSNGARGNRRYAGFLGRLEAITGSTATVEILDIENNVLGTWSFELGSADHCDPDPPLWPGETLLRLDSQIGAVGTLFIELRRLAQLGIGDGKIPIGLGA